MQLIALTDVVIAPNRFRRDFDKTRLLELAESITSKGLQHAIVLRDDRVTLVAGERRLRALAELYANGVVISHNGEHVPHGMVPFTCLKQLSPMELREAEFEENVIRTDFTWLEKTQALAALHQLRTDQAAAEGRVQTFMATATEVTGRPQEGGTYAGKVRNAMLINSFAGDPEVSGAKSEKEAFNIVKRKLTEKFTARLAANIRAEAKATPHVAHHGDALTLLASLDDAMFDVVITDPPYGIGADTFTATDGNESGNEHRYKDTPEYARGVMRAVLDESVRLCKPDAAMYMFCDHEYFDWLRGMCEQRGWTAWPRPIFWHKPSGGMMGDTLHGPRRSYETILFAYRGNKRTTGVYLDVIVHQPKDEPRHAAAKPVEVFVNLLRRSTVPGMTVLDPCMGIGPVFPAANQLQLRATGIELVEAHYNTALTRITEKE